jgi:serralysin
VRSSSVTGCLRPLPVRVCGVVLIALLANDVFAYSVWRPWSETASGNPTQVTWGFAEDGSSIPATGTSNLISFFDSVYDVATPGLGIIERAWFGLFEDSFDRWSQLSGITFIYEGADDGAVVQSSPGLLGVRADIRLAGKFIDGPSGALASTWLPNTGDIVLDTSDVGFFSTVLTDNPKARNTLKHEIGHSLGLMHIASSDAMLLMEQNTSSWYDGPQLDDIRGIQSLYGDFYEKSNDGLGNGIASRATPLGSLVSSSPLSIGSDAAGDQVVLPIETDFVSITNSADVDFYSFSVAAPRLLNISLTPRGGEFSHGLAGGLESILNANSQNDLSLAVIGPNGTTILNSSDQVGEGGIEVLLGVPLSSAGTYFVRVSGASDAMQLYELDLVIGQPMAGVAGDFNGDGAVNGRDFLIWQRSSGNIGNGLPADVNQDGIVDEIDMGVWRIGYGQSQRLIAAVGVPEPSGVVMLLLGVGAFAMRAKMPRV